jgi:hypothetical protein
MVDLECVIRAVKKWRNLAFLTMFMSQTSFALDADLKPFFNARLDISKLVQLGKLPTDQVDSALLKKTDFPSLTVHIFRKDAPPHNDPLAAMDVIEYEAYHALRDHNIEGVSYRGRIAFWQESLRLARFHELLHWMLTDLKYTDAETVRLSSVWQQKIIEGAKRLNLDSLLEERVLDKASEFVRSMYFEILAHRLQKDYAKEFGLTEEVLHITPLTTAELAYYIQHYYSAYRYQFEDQDWRKVKSFFEFIRLELSIELQVSDAVSDLVKNENRLRRLFEPIRKFRQLCSKLFSV